MAGTSGTLLEDFQLRIAGSSMQSYVTHALAHLLDPTKPPITLHNLPAQSAASSSLPPSVESLEKSCATSLHRLISVVEIVKREYAKSVKAGIPQATAPRPLRTGVAPKQSRAERQSQAIQIHQPALHQYNQLQCLEELGLAPQPTPEEIKLGMLEKGRMPRQRHTPIMLITLSRTSVPEYEDKREWSYQAPPDRPRKSRKRRRRARQELAAPSLDAQALNESSPDQGHATAMSQTQDAQ